MVWDSIPTLTNPIWSQIRPFTTNHILQTLNNKKTLKIIHLILYILLLPILTYFMLDLNFLKKNSSLNNLIEKLTLGNILKPILPNLWFSCSLKERLLQLLLQKRLSQDSLNYLKWQGQLTIILMTLMIIKRTKNQIYQINPTLFPKIKIQTSKNLETTWLLKLLTSRLLIKKKETLLLQCFSVKVMKETMFISLSFITGPIIMGLRAKKLVVWNF